MTLDLAICHPLDWVRDPFGQMQVGQQLHELRTSWLPYRFDSVAKSLCEFLTSTVGNMSEGISFKESSDGFSSKETDGKSAGDRFVDEEVLQAVDLNGTCGGQRA
jgi:hypothetical protein